MKAKPTALIVLDGLGIRKSKSANAVKQAKAPNLNNYFSNYPYTELEASGPSVGLPKGFMGNSEVGHFTLGAGRIVLQDMSMIDDAIAKKDSEGDFYSNKAFLRAIAHAKKHNSTLHLMGLLSDGGVHSHIRHLFALLELCKKENFINASIHCFLDGRDVPPKSSLKYIKMLETKIRNLQVGRIATLCGRYYAMDRDKRWDRQQKAYNLLVFNKGKHYKTAKEAILDNYKRGITDEFIEPSVIAQNNCHGTAKNNNINIPKNNACISKSNAMSCTHFAIKEFDSVIFFNFRSDRARQLTRALVQRTFRQFKCQWLKSLYFVGMVNYEKRLRIKIAFPQKIVKNSLGEWLSKKRKKQMRIAETEKYAHVTFFFNAGIEKPYKNEHRLLVNSPKVATYDLKPEMSAFEIKGRALEEIRKKKADFILINFANPDMVGHTGKLNAAIKAVEAADSCLGEIVSAILANDGLCIVTADHGNCEDMKGRYATSHTLNKVPCALVSRKREFQKGKIILNKGGLYDIAPTILELMKIPKPREMTGKSLINKR